jgi:hypothetical protein
VAQLKSVTQLHVPVSEVNEVTPAVIDTTAERDVHEGAPLRSLRFAEELHPGLVGKFVTLARVAGDAGADDIFPSRLPAAITGENVVDVEAGTVEHDTAVLAGVSVPFKNVVTGELDLLPGETIEKAEDDDPGNPDAEGNGLQHPFLGMGSGKITPTQKVMCQKITGAIGGYDLCLPLVKERERPAGRAGIDGLPQPVEHKDRLIQ